MLYLSKNSYLRIFVNPAPGPVFREGLRLSQLLGLNPVLKLRLLSQLRFVLKLYSQRVTYLSPRLSVVFCVM